MGCYNETCAISNVHIAYNDEVAVVLLQGHNEKYESYCYTDAYNSVAPLMFYGKYNDYGSVEDVAQSNTLDILVNQIKEELVEIEGSSNSYRDIPISRKDFDLEILL